MYNGPIMLTLEDIIKFVKLTYKFQQVKRIIFVKNEDRFENDLEHSAQLTLLALYITSSNKLKLDQEKVLKYALVHDLVEVYTGDVSFFDFTKRKGKDLREHKSALRLQKEFPKFRELLKLLNQYKSRRDPESKFIYTLDKVLPMVNVYLDHGRTWKHDGITLEMLVTHKTGPVSLNLTIQTYFQDLVKLLKRHKSYFPK